MVLPPQQEEAGGSDWWQSTSRRLGQEQVMAGWANGLSAAVVTAEETGRSTCLTSSLRGDPVCPKLE